MRIKRIDQFQSVVFLMILLWSMTSHAALSIDAVYPTLGLTQQNLNVTIRGTDFDQDTRVSMYVDSGNERAIVGSINTQRPYGVAVSNGYAYVVGNSYFRVLDISDSAHPQQLASIVIPCCGNDVAIRGNYAFLADGNDGGLRVINISVPDNPIIEPVFVDTPGTAQKITLSGNYAYIADHTGGLRIIDISTPSNPAEVGSFELGNNEYALDVDIQGNYAYLASYFKLKIIDISDPTSPTEAGEFPGNAFGVAVSGSYAYLGASAVGLNIVDISTPSNPVLVGNVDCSDTFSYVVLSGNLAYVVDRFSGVKAVDISTPSDPRIVGSFDTPEYAISMALSGNYLYVGDNSNSVQILDVSILSAPQIAGNRHVGSWAHDVDVVDDRAFVGISGSLQIIDISDVSNPTITTSVDVTPNIARDVEVSGNYAFVASGREFRVVDVIPGSESYLDTVATIATGSYGADLIISGSYAYLATRYDSGGGVGAIHIINISTPTSPYITDTLEFTNPDPDNDNIQNIALHYPYLYAASDSDGLQIVNVSNPYNPYIAGSYDTQPQAIGIALSYPYVYMGVLGHGFFILNVSSPSNPSYVTSLLDGSYWVQDILVKGNSLYVAHGYNGFTVLDISTPNAPQIIGTMDTLAYTDTLDVSGDYAFVADGNPGLTIVPLAQEIPSVTVNSATEISVTLPAMDIAGSYSLKVFNGSTSHVMPGAVSFTDNASLLNSKAIIVAGGGPDASGGLIWEETKTCANKAYNALILQGYEHDSIYYLTGETLNTQRDADANYAALSYAINTWAADATQLIIFFVDHGRQEEFVIKEDGGGTETLGAQELDSWMDNLQATMPGPLTFIYDACLSGSFIPYLTPPAGKERIVITGSSYEYAYFLENGLNSFSYHFWGKTLINQGNLGDTFLDAQALMQSYQNPLIESNWDLEGNSNESGDIQMAQGSIIRRGGYLYLGKHPSIGDISSPQIVSGTTSGTLWASGIIDADNVEAVIVPPDVNPETSDIPITDLPSVLLTDPDDDHVFQGIYNGFDTQGTYTVIIKASADQGFYSYVDESIITQSISATPLYTAVTKTDGTQSIEPDTFEEDDVFASAHVIVINDNNPQAHNFHGIGDVDWVKFYGRQGEIYKIKANRLSVLCDVTIELFDGDGITRIAGPVGSEGAGGAEYLEWTCPQDGVYFTKLSNSTTYFGENVKYELSVYQPIGPLAGFLRGIITDKDSGNPIGNALLKVGSNGSGLSLDNGAYLMVLPPDDYTLNVSASGYIATDSSVTISEGGTLTNDIEMEPDDIPSAIIDLPSENSLIFEGDSLNFQGTVVGGNTPFSYSWNFDGGATNADQEDPGDVIFPTEGNFEVVFTVTDDNGDMGTDTVTVTVNVDNCPGDPNKSDPGICGCGVTDTDTDTDGTMDCNDDCPNDPGKTIPGLCGCGVSDEDSDADGTPDCNDGCDSMIDSDGDGTGDCDENCPNDSDKFEPGICGCGLADTDSDTDGVLDCIDNCPADPEKTEAGVCGCGITDIDSDSDGTLDCNDPDDDNDGVLDTDDDFPLDDTEVRDTDEDGTGDNADTDDDNDGIDDTVEIVGPNSGDANDDGIQDHLQSSVASLESYNAQGYVVLESPAGTVLSSCQATDNPSPSDAPSIINFDYGFFDFSISYIVPGGSTALSMTLPPGVAPDTYYKYGKTPGNQTDHWYEFMFDGQTGAEINANVITLHFVDALRGDDELVQDSMVIDLGAPGFAITANDTEPVASITSPASNTTITVGESVNFQGSVTGGNTPLTYSWEFDGGVTDSNIINPGNVIFSTAGIYVVTFTVTDMDNDTDTATVTITVNASIDDGDDGGGGGGGGGGGCYLDSL